jgi:hypothetical protein
MALGLLSGRKRRLRYFAVFLAAFSHGNLLASLYDSGVPGTKAQWRGGKLIRVEAAVLPSTPVVFSQYFLSSGTLHGADLLLWRQPGRSRMTRVLLVSGRCS